VVSRDVTLVIVILVIDFVGGGVVEGDAAVPCSVRGETFRNGSVFRATAHTTRPDV
jgi:hypothetical protein